MKKLAVFAGFGGLLLMVMMRNTEAANPASADRPVATKNATAKNLLVPIRKLTVESVGRDVLKIGTSKDHEAANMRRVVSMLKGVYPNFMAYDYNSNTEHLSVFLTDVDVRLRVSVTVATSCNSYNIKGRVHFPIAGLRESAEVERAVLALTIGQPTHAKKRSLEKGVAKKKFEFGRLGRFEFVLHVPAQAIRPRGLALHSAQHVTRLTP